MHQKRISVGGTGNGLVWTVLSDPPIRGRRQRCGLINGDRTAFGVEVREDDGTLLETLFYKEGKQIVSEQVSKTMRRFSKKFVSEGGGKKAYIRGYHIGGKTATSSYCHEVQINTFPLFLDLFGSPRITWNLYYKQSAELYYGAITAPVMRTVLKIFCLISESKEAARNGCGQEQWIKIEHLLSAE